MPIAEDSYTCLDTTSRSEEFFKSLVESRSGMLLLFRRDGSIHYSSPSVEEISDFSSERILGDSIWSMLHPEDHSEIEEIISEGGARVGSFRLRLGSDWISICGSVQNLLEDPNVNGVVLAGRKVSHSADDLHRLELRGKEYNTVFDCAPVGLARVGLDGRWLRVNRSLCEMLDYEREELIGRTFQEITHSDDLALDMKIMQEFLRGERNSLMSEKRYIRKDYSIAWVNLSASIIRDDNGEPLYFECVIQDIAREVAARRISSSLTDREHSVLGLLAHGKTNKEIASSLKLSLSSAKVYVRRIVEKLDATDRTHAAVRAAHLGLLTNSDY